MVKKTQTACKVYLTVGTHVSLRHTPPYIPSYTSISLAISVPGPLALLRTSFNAHKPEETIAQGLFPRISIVDLPNGSFARCNRIISHEFINGFGDIFSILSPMELIRE